MASAVEIPVDWNPGYAVWPGTSSQPDVRSAFQALADDLQALNGRHAGTQAALDALVSAYNAHIATGGVHLDEDTENPITSPVATDVTVDILALVNDAYTKYEAHRVNVTGGIHGAPDATNVVTATAPATNEAEAIALMNDVKAMYELHRVLTGGGEHGVADATNTIASADATDWDSLVTLANEFKNTTGFNDHIALTAGPVHGADGSADAITAADSGAQITALQTELNEIKANYNTHSASEGFHPLAGAAEATADASDEATAVALANALKATLNTHYADAGVHLDADGAGSVTVADSTEYEDILALVADLRSEHDSHIARVSVHTSADAANAGTPLGTGGAVTIKLTAA